MSQITQDMDRQYSDSEKLAARARLSGGFSKAEVPWFTWVAQHVSVSTGAKILDVGCGPAWFWQEAVSVLPEGLDVTLFDQSPGMVAEAETRCRALPFASISTQVGDAASLPFADESFDALIAMHMLYHVKDQAAAIAEFHRVLKPGGTLLVTTNGRNNMAELYVLTTVFGSAPRDPAGDAFGLDRAEHLLKAQFGNAALKIYPATMRVTDPEVVYLAMTSYPPGDTAPTDQQAAFRAAIHSAFEAGNGGVDVTKEVGLVVSRKAA
ncbi:class I SAM-dependent methyltransferase [Devosia sp. Leaf64]|uniref:class I SAM-dependent methyltransferase n=1 Tax=Devosia sp. Leaf64 TaxID=1736229 RepID=UPI0007162492|nr:class I SAM-dependent methyltransferase [Devosia sp. Leaf64]KQN72559.1 methyltransferase [Devosia sp. Leaf64]